MTELKSADGSRSRARDQDAPDAASGAERTANRAGAALAAAETAASRHTVTLTIPGFGQLHIGEPKHLPFYAAIGVLAVVDVIDWPVAAIVVLGKLLADNAHREIIRDFGEALEAEA